MDAKSSFLESLIYKLIEIEPYYIYSLIVFGLVGNCLSLRIFYLKRLEYVNICI
jgi:hypothetical protein